MQHSCKNGSGAETPVCRRAKINGLMALSVVEVLVMVSVVSIGLAVFIPKYTKSQAESKRQMCILNLRSMDTAVQQWAIESKMNSKSTYVLNTNKILAYLKDGRLPECPTGGSYAAGTNVSKPPTCSNSADGHSL